VQCHRTDLIIIKEYLKTEILDKTYPSVGKLLQNFKKIAKSQLKLIVMVLMLWFFVFSNKENKESKNFFNFIPICPLFSLHYYLTLRVLQFYQFNYFTLVVYQNTRDIFRAGIVKIKNCRCYQEL